jgi:tRNA(fMet)-specific endonuclease VapC
MRYLIDSDCAIYAMTDADSPLIARIAECEPGDIGISAISFGEVTLGSELGRPPPLEILEAFLAAIPIVSFDGAAARAYARLPFKRARFDRLLAAHALSIGATVITNNEADFADVPGLQIENWTV